MPPSHQEGARTCSIDARQVSGTVRFAMGQLPFTSGARCVLEASMEKASQLGHNDLGPDKVRLLVFRKQQTLEGPGVLAELQRLFEGK